MQDAVDLTGKDDLVLVLDIAKAHMDISMQMNICKKKKKINKIHILVLCCRFACER